MLTAEAPFAAFPERLTAPLLFELTMEPAAATALFSSPAAVTLSIWLSRSAWVLVCFLSDDDFDLLWPYACPETTKAATRVVVVTMFFTYASTALVDKTPPATQTMLRSGQLTPAWLPSVGARGQASRI